jgi:pimeloyl-ACP methyl ester carboxylesterase
MPFLATPPPLPAFLAPHLPFPRRAYRLESGPDAGRSLHFLDSLAPGVPGVPGAASGAPSQGRPRPRPVLLLHGNPTWSFLWRKVIGLLPGARCVAPDLLGLGFSDKPERIADHTLERHGNAIAELLSALDLRDVVLVGQDWGGPIAAQVGALHPQRVAGLVLANTSVLVPRRSRGTAFHRFARIPVLSDLAFRGFGFPLGLLGRLQADPHSLHGIPEKAYRFPLRTWRERVAPLALARMVPDGPAHPSIPAIARGEAWVLSFGGPVALVWGIRDPILGRTLERHERALPQAAVTRMEAGHFLQEEVPAALAAAITKISGSAPPIAPLPNWEDIAASSEIGRTALTNERAGTGAAAS